jgi:hypothetical protein
VGTQRQQTRIFLLCNIWRVEEIKDLDLDAIAEEFAKGVPDNVILPANITVYIKEARTPKEAVEHVHELTTKIEITIKQKREKSRVNTIWTNLIRI